MKEELFNFLDSKKVSDAPNTMTKINEFKEYIKKFFQEYPKNNIEKIMTIPNIDVMLPLIILSNPLKTSKIVTTINKYTILFENKRFNNLIPLLYLYYNDEDFKDIVNSSLSPNPLIHVPAIIKLNKKILEKELVPVNADIISFFQKYPNAIKDLEVVFINFGNSLYKIGLEFIKERDEYSENSENTIQDILSFLPRSEKRLGQKILKEKKRTKGNLIDAIQKYFNFLSAKYNDIINDYKKRERIRLNHNKNIEELKKLLDTNEEITDIDDILKLCNNDKKIQELVIDFIINHNRKIYRELIDKYEKIKLNSDKNLTSLFAKYGFVYETLSANEKKEIKELNYNNIEDILKKLNSFQILNVNIVKVSLYKLTKIEELIIKGIITPKWLKENEDLLYNDNNLLEQVITNINILSQESINMVQYPNSLDITKSRLVNHNLCLLRDYGLVITRSTTNINFLAVTNLKDRIEFIISIGLYQELTDLNILNNPIEYLIRIKIANLLNISVKDIQDDLSEIFFDFSENLIPYKIKCLLKGESNYLSEIPDYLVKYKIDQETLNINGIYVSIKKLQRNLAKLKNNNPENCFYSIIYNGYYTFEEIEILKSIIIPEHILYNQVRS